MEPATQPPPRCAGVNASMSTGECSAEGWSWIKTSKEHEGYKLPLSCFLADTQQQLNGGSAQLPGSQGDRDDAAASEQRGTKIKKFCTSSYVLVRQKTL